MKIVKGALAALAATALVLAGPVAVTFASPGVTHTFTFTSNDPSEGTIGAQENSPQLLGLSSPAQVDDGAVVIAGGFPTTGNKLVSITNVGGSCPNPNVYGPETDSWGPITADCSVLFTFAPLSTPAPPVAGAVSATVAYGSSSNPITLNLTGGTAANVAVASQAAHGTATASGTSISYTPTSGYSGPDSFTYKATNGGGTSAAAIVTITVNPQPPIAGAVSATVAYNSSANPITLNLGGGTATSVAVPSPAAHGTATASGTSISYTPTSGYSGPDSFTYKATNAGGTSAAAIVTITVSPQPTHTVTFSSSPSEAGTISVTELTPSPGPLVSGQSVPDGATIEIDSAPNPGWATHSIGGTYHAITIGPSGTFVTFLVDENTSVGWAFAPTSAPIANATSAALDENAAATDITLPATGVGISSYGVASNPSHGTVTFTAGVVHYTPDANYSGTDSFTYTASNATGTSDPATVSITVNPVFVGISTSLEDSNHYLLGVDGSVLGTVTVTDVTTSTVIPNGGSAREGDNLEIVTATASGYAATSVIFGSGCGAPVSGDDADEILGPLNADCTISAVVEANSVPTVAATTATLAANSGAASINLPVAGPVATSVDSITGASHGTLTISGTTATYTPDAGYSGPDNFTYSATNSAGTSTTATVSITVTPPVVSLSLGSVVAGDTVTVTGTGFAADESITVVLHSTPVTLGTFTADGTGALSATVTIPASTSAGSHTLLVTGATSGTITTALTVTVAARVLGNTGGITYSEIATDIALAALLAAIGTFLVLRTRRKRHGEPFLG